MLIYDVNKTEGSLSSETKAYYDHNKLNLNLVQVLYRGPKVISYSSIDLKPSNFSEIIQNVSRVHIQNFMTGYNWK